jgi:hypothetical protein
MEQPTFTQVRHFVRAAKIVASKTAGITLTGILHDIIAGQFTANVQSGRSVVSVAIGGTQTEFAVSGDFTPEGIMSLANHALDWLETLPDPDNPDLRARPIKSILPSFSDAQL